MLAHAGRKEHHKSLEKLASAWVAQPPPGPEIPDGVVSGLDLVPRLDRFLAAATTVADHGSYTCPMSDVLKPKSLLPLWSLVGEVVPTKAARLSLRWQGLSMRPICKP